MSDKTTPFSENDPDAVPSAADLARIAAKVAEAKAEAEKVKAQTGASTPEASAPNAPAAGSVYGPGGEPIPAASVGTVCRMGPVSRAAFQKHVQAHVQACPLCGMRQFHLHDLVSMSPLLHLERMIPILGAGAPMAHITCANCAHTMSFALRMITTEPTK